MIITVIHTNLVPRSELNFWSRRGTVNGIAHILVVSEVGQLLEIHLPTAVWVGDCFLHYRVEGVPEHLVAPFKLPVVGAISYTRPKSTTHL